MMISLSIKYYRILVLVALISLALGFAAGAVRAESTPVNEVPTFASGVQAGLEKIYPGSRIEVAYHEVVWKSGTPDSTGTIQLLADNGRGWVRFAQATAIGEVPYRAWTRVWEPAQRILPNQKIEKNMLKSVLVDVAQGRAHDFRALYLGPDAPIDLLESRNTLLENQPVMASAVRKIPANRKGDLVQVQLNTGGISLQTQGTLEEPAEIGQIVKILSQKTKRLLSGTLVAVGRVEVIL